MKKWLIIILMMGTIIGLYMAYHLYSYMFIDPFSGIIHTVGIILFSVATILIFVLRKSDNILKIISMVFLLVICLFPVVKNHLYSIESNRNIKRAQNLLAAIEKFHKEKSGYPNNLDELNEVNSGGVILYKNFLLSKKFGYRNFNSYYIVSYNLVMGLTRTYNSRIKSWEVHD